MLGARVHWAPTVLPCHAPRRGGHGARAAGIRCFSTAGSEGDNAGELVVRFSMPYRCEFGQQVCLVGGCERLGQWDVERALPMAWSEGDVWTAELHLPVTVVEQPLEYKYVVRAEQCGAAVRWTDGANYVLKLARQAMVRVQDAWDHAQRQIEIEVRVPGGVGPPRRGRPKRVDEDEAAAKAIGKAADKALQQLDAAVAASLQLQGTQDPASPELLAADRVVAAAAQRASAMSKALEAASSPKVLPQNVQADPLPRRRRGGSKGA